MHDERPSDTAHFIALNRTLAAQEPRFRSWLRHPEEPYSPWFVQAHSPGARRQLALFSWPPLRRLLFTLGERSAPGGTLYMLLRKAYLEDCARAFLAKDGPRQLVVFGAGYDPLCLLLRPDFPDASFFETDHPATQGVKLAALQAQNVSLERLTLLPIDYQRETAAAKLHASGFRTDIPTLFLAEGLLMYLPMREVDSVFNEVRSLAAPGSRFIFSILDRAILDDPTSFLAGMERRLQRLGEPFRSALTQQEALDYTRSQGMVVEALLDADELRRRYVEPLGEDLPVLSGELLVSSRPNGEPTLAEQR